MFISNILLGSNGSFIGSAASGSTSGAGQIGAVVLGSILVASAGASSGVGQPGGLVAGSVLSASNGSGAGHGQSPGATFGAVFIGIGGSAAGVGQQADLIIGHIANASNGESLGVGQDATGIFGASIPFIGVGSNGSAAGFGQLPTAALGVELLGDIGQSLGVGQTGQLVAGFIGSGAAGIANGDGHIALLDNATPGTVTLEDLQAQIAALSAAIPSMVQDAMTAQGYTTTRAPYLDNAGSLTFTVAGQVDSNCESMNGHALQGDGSTASPIETVNWDG